MIKMMIMTQDSRLQAAGSNSSRRMRNDKGVGWTQVASDDGDVSDDSAAAADDDDDDVDEEEEVGE